jgi:hypothetical protein
LTGLGVGRNKMKKSNLFFLVVTILLLMMRIRARAQSTQYVTFTNSVALTTNQIVSVVGYDWADVRDTGTSFGANYFTKPLVVGYFPTGDTINITPFNGLRYLTQTTTSTGISTAYSSFSSQIPQIVAGLTNISVSYGWATIKIETPASANVVTNSYVPANVVVIPTSATGTVQIILESSTDLINWTAANPGTYGASSATNRFFRVRAVHN